ncbi:membrane protein YdbS with pleckstrin-like domain [Alkalibacillus flavidus]|uniref:Membrane protein YdbS with pleckstrin-like domain n=1 Tax=Alkalibacillus flavidus TaxID=546021 RepID=A0ABV2KWK8_9BACI
MRQPPQHWIAEDAVKAWRMADAIVMAIVLLLVIASFIVGHFFNWPLWISVTALVVWAVLSYVIVFVIPIVRWRRWRYEVFDQEIYVQHGILIVSRTLVPMIRVQHVDTKQGPILKRFGLSNLTVSTAATVHEIPALPQEEAAALRDQISELARVDEDDV